MVYDLGTFGSDGYYSAGDQRLFPLHNQIFSGVFNGSISMKQRDEMLIRWNIRQRIYCITNYYKY